MVSQSGTFGSVASDVDGKHLNVVSNAETPTASGGYSSQSSVPFGNGQGAPTIRTLGAPDAVVAAYLSTGIVQTVPGVSSLTAAASSTCFSRVCASLGVETPYYLCRVKDLPDDVLLYLQTHSKKVKVYYEYSADNARLNHIELVSPSINSSRIEVLPVNGDTGGFATKVVGVTNLVQFFNSKNPMARIQFYSGEDSEIFGADMDSAQRNDPIGPSGPAPRQTGRHEPRVPSGGSAPRGGPRDPSVSDPGSRHGAANLSSGVLRPRRRVVAAKAEFSPYGAVQKSYTAASGVKFNNLNEIYLDVISREYAQEILEEVFSSWSLDLTDPEVVKYAEDLVWAFMIATTASNKADYYREFDVPHKSGTVVVSFDVFSRILAEKYSVTRRQFARSVSDDMRRYIREPENLHLLPRLASRVGCDPQMANLAFDGSTHCTNLTSAELSFTKLLENRNLFEDDSLMADGASQRLMQGMSSGPRSIISR